MSAPTSPPPGPAAPPLVSGTPRSDDARSDLIGGSVLVIIGLAAMAGALQLPRPGGTRAVTMYLTYSGALPLLLGIAIACGGFALIGRAWRRRAVSDRRGGGGLLASLRKACTSRGAFVLGSITVYALVLILQLLPFWAATYFYLAVTMVLLRAGSLPVVLLTSLGTSVGLHVLFGTLLGLPLP